MFSWSNIDPSYLKIRSGAVAKVNNRGESAQPCVQPTLILIGSKCSYLLSFQLMGLFVLILPI